MMPLQATTGTPLSDKWAISFNMLSPTRTSVQCMITRGALDELAGGRGLTTVDQQAKIFEQRRTEIEALASAKYDKENHEDGMVVVGPEDIEEAGLRRR